MYFGRRFTLESQTQAWFSFVQPPVRRASIQGAAPNGNSTPTLFGRSQLFCIRQRLPAIFSPASVCRPQHPHGIWCQGAETRLLDIREVRRLSTPAISRLRHPFPKGLRDTRLIVRGSAVCTEQDSEQLASREFPRDYPALCLSYHF